jgi:hypothetical protein
MTDESRGIGGTVGPPWPVDLLADLHAGVLDDAESARLWPQVNADPDARAVLDALDSTVSDLGALPLTPAPPMPPEVAARIDAALAEAGQRDEPAVAPVVSLDTARRRRGRMLGWGAGALTVAAAAVAAIAILVPNGQSGGGTPPVAAPDTSGDAGKPPLSLSSGGVGTAFGEINGVRDFGPLGDEQRLDSCLDAAGIDPDIKPAGIRPVTLDGQEAVMVLYPTGELAQYRMIALSPDCGPDNPGLLLDKTIGQGAGG